MGGPDDALLMDAVLRTGGGGFGVLTELRRERLVPDAGTPTNTQNTKHEPSTSWDKTTRDTTHILASTEPLSNSFLMQLLVNHMFCLMFSITKTCWQNKIQESDRRTNNFMCMLQNRLGKKKKQHTTPSHEN